MRRMDSRNLQLRGPRFLAHFVGFFGTVRGNFYSLKADRGHRQSD